MTSHDKVKGEYRRIQVTGGSTYTLSLPRLWVEKSGLSRGSLVVLAENEDGSLAIHSEQVVRVMNVGKAVIEVSLGDSPDSVVRSVVSAYIAGYSLIQINSRGNRIDVRIKASVKEIVRRKFVGTEILSEGPDELTLQVMLRYSDLPIDDALKRMAAMALSMHRNAFSALKTGDSRLASVVIDDDAEVDRFSLYISRLLKMAVSNPQLAKNIGVGKSDSCLSYALIVKAIERAADHAVSIAGRRLSVDVDYTFFGEVEDAEKLVLNIFESSVDAVFSRSYGASENLIRMGEDARRKIDLILVKCKESEGIQPQLSLIIESIIRTLEYAKAVAEMVLNMTIYDVVTET
jgi:phosphate uptake regulator